MRHEVSRRDGTVILSLRGEVDLEQSPAVRALLLDLLEEQRDLLVDLAGVTYIDSSGVATLVEAYQLSKQHGTAFALVSVSPAVHRVLELARLDRVFTIHQTLEEGLGGGGS